jgi:hypothetical protein
VVLRTTPYMLLRRLFVERRLFIARLRARKGQRPCRRHRPKKWPRAVHVSFVVCVCVCVWATQRAPAFAMDQELWLDPAIRNWVLVPIMVRVRV